jgi:general secretion pathway protein D
MARINSLRFSGWVLLVLMLFYAGGCSTYQARKAFEKAEQLASEEKFDAAVGKYQEATDLDSASKRYKLKLISSRTNAAASHIRKARQLASGGALAEALAEYRQAREFDPSLEIASQEESTLRTLLEAQNLAEEGARFYGQKNPGLARKAIDKALKRDANNARALAIKDLLDQEQKTTAMDGIELDVASSEPITLSFKDANIKEVFGILSKLSGINFIFDEEIRTQSISVLLEKASFAQAMELIMQMNGLGKKVLNSKTIIIYPQSREKEKQYGDQVIQTFFLSHIDAKKAVNLLRTMLQLRKVYVHEERNALVVRDKPEVIRLAEQILNAADRENSEVIFDLELVAVSSGDKLDFGPKLSTYSVGAGFSEDGENIVRGALGTTTDGLVTSLRNLQTYYTVPSATFDFAKTLSDSEILASPKIRVKNKEKAKVHIGTREPVITVTQNGDNFSDSVQYVDVGVKLDIEPNIQLDKTVETKLKLEVSQKIGEDTTTRGTKVLTISTTNAETVLTLKDGVQTIIGGLFEQQDTTSRTTIPFLGEIPLLGSLFTNFGKNDTKREILLSVTPYIINQVEVPNADVATIWSGGEDDLKNGPNFGSFAQSLTSDVSATKPLAAPAVKPMRIENTAAEELLPSDVSEAATDADRVPEGGSAEEVLSPVDTESSATVVPAEETEAAEETVPTEDMEDEREVGGPVVLEMPQKAPPVVSFSGPEQAELGKELVVAVQVKDIEKLYSAPLFVSYDPAVLELMNINEGTFLKQDGQSTVFSSSPNRTTGQVIVGYKQGAGGKGASGSGDLFNLVFKPIASAETRIEINRVNFRDPEGMRLQVVPETIKIEVR